jgi:hypothetical protein
MTISARLDRIATLDLHSLEEETFNVPTELAPVSSPLVALVNAAIALPYRFWWHTKAYGTILGIVALASVSFVVLFLHQRLRRSFQR